MAGLGRTSSPAAAAACACPRSDASGVAGEARLLASGVNDLLDTLGTMVERVREASHATSQASAEIVSGANDLSSRTEQQASALEQTAATAEQLAASVPFLSPSLRLQALPGRGKGFVAVRDIEPGELLLFATGREARVDYAGDAAAIAAVRDAPKGL